MASERSLRLRKTYAAVLSGVIILAGICLMVACVGIYRSGEEPFSREAVAAAFSPIALPIYLCLAMVIVGFLLKLFFPAPEAKLVGAKQYSVMLKRLRSRADLENCNDDLTQQIQAEQHLRAKQNRVCGLVLALCSAAFLVYALDGRHFHSSDINGSMINAMRVLLPCLAVSLGICLFTVSARQKSMLREMELLKQCPKSAAVAEETNLVSGQKAKYILLAAGIALAVFGFFSGGTADVLTKAVNICTECIGLG